MEVHRICASLAPSISTQEEFDAFKETLRAQKGFPAGAAIRDEVRFHLEGLLTELGLEKCGADAVMSAQLGEAALPQKCNLQDAWTNATTPARKRLLSALVAQRVNNAADFAKSAIQLGYALDLSGSLVVGMHEVADTADKLADGSETPSRTSAVSFV